MKVLLSICLIATIGMSAAAEARGFDTRTLGQFGTVDLAHVRSWKNTPRLRKQIEAELRKSGKSADDVDCLGRRFPGTWKHLGGDRAPPFVCHFGTKDLHVSWTVTLVGKHGRRFIRPSARGRRNAKDYVSANPVWRWSAPDANAEP